MATVLPLNPQKKIKMCDLVSINDLAVGTDSQGTLLAAVDNGCLVSYNIRRRRLELVSEPLGYSARSVVTIKVS